MYSLFILLDGKDNVPHIKLLSNDMIIGEPLVFECNVDDSNPPPDIKWNYQTSDGKIKLKVNAAT